MFIALKALVGKVKRSLPKALKPMMLSWLKALFDPENVVRAAAKASFIAAFPPNKIADAFMYCRQEILDGVEENIKHTVQTLCDPKLYTKEEADEMYDRTISSSLLALAYVLESISPQQASEYFQGHEGIWGMSPLWKFSTHSSVLVRAAFYTLIRVCCIHAPQNLHNEAYPSESKLKTAIPVVLGSFGDKDSAGHQKMWECVLVFMKTFPSSWNIINLPKAVLPRLWSFVRHAAYGSVEISYPCLVTFIDLYVQAGGQLDLHSPMLENLWASLRVTGLRDPKQKECILDTYLECLKHGLVYMVRKEKVNEAKQLLENNVGLYLNVVFSSEECCVSRSLMTLKIAQTLEFLVEQKALVILQSDLREFVLSLVLNKSSLSSPSSDQAIHVTEFVCSFSRDSGSTSLFISIAARLCLDAVASARDADNQKQLILLKILASAVSWWGCRLFDQEALYPQDRTLHRHTAESFCKEELTRIISSNVTNQSSSDLIDGASLDTLSAAFVIAVNICKNDQLRHLVWPMLLECVIGDRESFTIKCASLQALAVLMNTVIHDPGASGSWSCLQLDEIVLRCLCTLCFRTEGAPAPGILESARLAAVVLHSVPPGCRHHGKELSKQRDISLLSDAGLEQLAEHLIEYLRAAAQKRSANLNGKHFLINEGAGPAALDVSERLISGATVWLGGEASASDPFVAVSKHLSSMVDAIFALLGHSDGAAKSVPYHHSAAEGSRIRSRLGCRASEVWSLCGRDAKVLPTSIGPLQQADVILRKEIYCSQCCSD